jgi:lipoprotein-anchoring transpeptidase ErfK/SrfK
MRSKSFLAVAGLIAVLLVAAGVVYAYDSSREDLIAKGITVGGVDVGGMNAADARARLRERVVEPLAEPVVARYKGRRFTLTPEAARVGVDVDGSVRAAVERSRAGGILSRTYRGLTGGRVNAALDLDITYDDAAIAKVVNRVRSKLDREPVDAEVDFSGGQVAPQDSEEGRQVAASRLERDLERHLTSPTASRRVKVRTRPVEPEVTSEELADKYPAVVIVNRNAFQLQLYKRLEPAKTYRVAVGQAGLETPAGLYSIQNMAVDPAWHVPESDWAGDLAGKVIPPGPENPIKARWMGIYDGAGIHGTDAIGSLGTAASHGCIRMAIPDVEELYEQVDVGTPVYIL